MNPPGRLASLSATTLITTLVLGFDTNGNTSVPHIPIAIASSSFRVWDSLVHDLLLVSLAGLALSSMATRICARNSSRPMTVM